MSSSKYNSGIVTDINYIPRRGNWPVNATGYFCGTIPYNNAPCLSTAQNNVDQFGPSTFAGCCNGPLINITQAMTDVNNPSYGATCLAYCAVDVSRTMELRGGSDFGEYFRCINNQATDSPSSGGEDENGDQIYGSVTCGWTGVSEHDKCESSISILKTNTVTQAPIYPWSQLDETHRTTKLVTTTTYSTCPAQTTAARVASSTPTPTTRTGAADGIRPHKIKSWIGLSFAVILMAQMRPN